ncbi:MAG: DnaJ family molecular chaperone [Pseudomonadota bacterium]
MSVWTQLSEFLSEIASDAFSSVVEAVRTVFEGDPETRKQVGFSVAMIALSAKMAKADGVVTVDEVRAFQQIFDIPEKEFNNVSRLYNIAKQDVAGFHSYASKVRNLFPDEKDILEDVMDGLFHIAKADGLFHEKEMAFMDDVADIFGIEGKEYERLRLRHMEPEDGDPYVLLEADPSWESDTLKTHYRKLVSENHPDRMIARGVPAEFIAISNERLAQINKAWGRIKLERGL